MTDADRFRLLFGPYATPRCRFGDVVTDEVRDCDVVIVGIADARMPWPTGKHKGGRDRGLVIFRCPGRSGRHESNQAVCYWWGVTPQMVTKWRKALEVGRRTEGSTRLRSDYFLESWAREPQAKAHAKTGDPTRRAKIATAMRGKPRPAYVVDGMRQRRQGAKHSDEIRRKMSATHRARRTLRPSAVTQLTEAEDTPLQTPTVVPSAPVTT